MGVDREPESEMIWGIPGTGRTFGIPGKSKTFRESFRNDEEYIKWMMSRNTYYGQEVSRLAHKLVTAGDERDRAERELALRVEHGVALRELQLEYRARVDELAALRREYEPNLSWHCRKGLHAGCDWARCECECAHKEKNRET